MPPPNWRSWRGRWGGGSATKSSNTASQVNDDATRIPLQGLQLVDIRTQLLATDSLREGAADDYALVRDAWMQRRQYQIFGDRVQSEDEIALPDYLQDDTLPLVPAGAVPVMPTDG